MADKNTFAAFGIRFHSLCPDLKTSEHRLLAFTCTCSQSWECFLDIFPGQAPGFRVGLPDVAIEVYCFLSCPFLFQSELYRIFVLTGVVAHKRFLSMLSIFNSTRSTHSQRFERQACDSRRVCLIRPLQSLFARVSHRRGKATSVARLRQRCDRNQSGLRC